MPTAPRKSPAATRNPSASAAPGAQTPKRAAAPAGKKKAPKATAPKAKPATPADKPSPKPKQKLVRDSFTMPASDFALIAALKARAMAGQREAKKSELLRAGLQALAALDGPALVAALGRLQPLKVGRPKKH